MEALQKILKTVRKELDISGTLDNKLRKLAENKFVRQGAENTVFITQDSTGAIVELSKKKGPFVVGQLLYSRAKPEKSVSGGSKVLKELKTLKSVKSAKGLKPCPPGKVRNPVSGRCVNEVKKSKK